MTMNADTRRSPCTGGFDRGYLVYVENFKDDSKTVYPNDPCDRGYTAEEVAEQWPHFADTVGITQGQDRDFDEPSP